jgi:hypothetical protein
MAERTVARVSTVVPLSTLEAPDVGPVNARQRRQPFLRVNAGLPSQGLQSSADLLSQFPSRMSRHSAATLG